MTTSPVERAAQTFAAVLGQWRVDRGMTKKQLAALMGFDPSYVSHVEGRRHRPTEDFARRAENVLDAGGAIWDTYAAYEEVRQSATSSPRPPMGRQEADGWPVPGVGLIVEREHAAIGLRDNQYH